jgi:hypothetical protein
MNDAHCRPAPAAKGYDLLATVVDQVSYKPGYSIFLSAGSHDHVLLSVCSPDLPDSRQIGTVIGVTINRTVDVVSIESEVDALREVCAVVAAFELHESAEWLRHGKQRVFAPHVYEDSGGFEWAHFAAVTGRFVNREKAAPYTSAAQSLPS